MTGIELISKEREKQIKKGYDSEHDKKHLCGELSDAAIVYAIREYWKQRSSLLPLLWPFYDKNMPKSETKEDRINNLTKAGALIAAEIDRLQNQ